MSTHEARRVTIMDECSKGMRTNQQAAQRQGTPIGVMDMLIAAHAKAKGLIIVTHSVREFKRVEGLVLENWVNVHESPSA